MRYCKRIAALALCAGLLSGCTMLNSGDDLLQQPKPPESYLLLQNKLAELENSMTPISPQSGQYRNTVTFEDLNGDGNDEAIATMCSKKSGKVQVFVFQLINDEYKQIGHISGQGSAISSLAFPSLEKDRQEKGMIITWNLSNSLEQGMTVCALQDGEMTALRELEYTDYTVCDLDGDKADELFTLNYMDNGKTANVYNYNAQKGKLELLSQAAATQDIQSPVNITTGRLASGETAVFVDNKYETDNGMQTDVYVLEKKQRDSTAKEQQRLQNLALTTELSTYRSVSLYYSEDIDSDGRVEVPQLVSPPEAEGDSSVGSLWYVDWYQFTLEGEQVPQQVATTYISINEEWKLFLPDGWQENVSVHVASDSDISQTLFLDVETDEVLLTIYVYAEKDRDRISQIGGVKEIGGSNSRCYAMRVENAESPYAVTESVARSSFAQVHTDWY